jgi:glucose/arabinose dehydrogenase
MKEKLFPMILVIFFTLWTSCQERQREQETARQTAELPTPDPDNGGLTLPQGFSAVVVADSVGKARHIAINENGDIYVALRSSEDGKGIVALRDTNGDGKADVTERFGIAEEGTGIRIHDNHLYFSTTTEVYRYPLSGNQLVPQGNPELIVTGFIPQDQHNSKPFTFDGDGNIYVNVGAPSNTCMVQTRTKGSPGQDPCPQLERQAGIWKFRADQPNQDQVGDGERYATGIRNAMALSWNHNSNNLYALQHGRDQLDAFWPAHFTAEQNATITSEEFMLVKEGYNNGWPYCFYSLEQRKRVLSPEYGGDGKTVGQCDQYEEPILAFPAHWAPNDLLFYTDDQFGDHYTNGAFITFHGSWNRAPLEQAGYIVAFVPFSGDKPSGDFERFADGFTRAEKVAHPSDAQYRPMGIAQGPDGSLYITDSNKGKIWRVFNSGDEDRSMEAGLQ